MTDRTKGGLVILGIAAVILICNGLLVAAVVLIAKLVWGA